MSEEVKQQTFEEAMTNLEKIVSDMERGGIPLEQMIAKFEEGARLAKFCQDKLASLKKKMELLTIDQNGTTAWKEMSAAETGEDQASRQGL